MRQLTHYYPSIVFMTLLMTSTINVAQQSPVQLAVWANEAVVATYTYDYRNFITEQHEIAKYFTASGWTAYSAALTKSQLPQLVQKNSYFVSAAALLPVEVKTIDSTHWQAKMPLVVVYRNPQYQQKQTLEVTIKFGAAPSGQGIRGLAISSIESVVIKEPCKCS